KQSKLPIEIVALRERHHKAVRDQGPTLTSGLRYRAPMSTPAVAVMRPGPLSSQAERSFRSCPAASVLRFPTTRLLQKSRIALNRTTLDFASVTSARRAHIVD